MTSAMGGTRAAAYDEYTARMSLVFGEDGGQQTFTPRPTDIIISPFSKCGTTWLQQIVHGLRTGDDMDFDDISRVVPWIEAVGVLGIDLDAEQRAEPRAFKSHLSWHDVPKGGRYVVSVRDPKDALVSLYHFMVGWIIEPGSISIDEFARWRSFDRDNGTDYWRHLSSWLEQRANTDVLLVAFENMKVNLPAVVARIAGFIGIQKDPALLEVATHQASFAFMSRNKQPFIDHLVRTRSELVAGIPPGGDSAKVRKGKVGASRHELSPDVAATFDRIWDETIRVEFGYATYADLVMDLPRDDSGA